MRQDTSERAISGRVLTVALDATADCRAMLDAATALAQLMGADLRGVWVQDDNLHRLAGLPFVTELAFASESPRPLDADALERTLSRLASRLQSMMAERADRRHVPWELRARRGSVETTLAAESAGAELLIVGQVKRVHHVNHVSGQVASRLCALSPVPVLVLPPGERVRGPLAVLLSGATNQAQADVAVRLAHRVGGEVLLLHTTGEEAAVSRMSGRLTAQGIACRPIEMADASVASVTAALRRGHAGLLIVGTEAGVVPDTQLLAHVGCPLLIVSD